MNYTLHLGDNLATLKNYPDNTFDSIVTDPPYLISFLGKEWDHGSYDMTPLFKECLRVLKPGGYLLAFSAPRTYHKTATMIETAGFEIRDQINWIFSSGFPKAQDIGKAIQKRLGVEETEPHRFNTPGVANSNDVFYTENSQSTVCTSPLAKEWEGFKTALKPAAENICMARKPFKGSTIDNVLKNGLGALNIDATRVPWADEKDADTVASFEQTTFANKIGSVETIGTHTYDRRTVIGGLKKKKSDRDVYLGNIKGPCERAKTTHGENTGMFGGDAGFKVIKKEVNEDDLPEGGRYPSNVIGEVDEDIQKYFMNPQDPPKKKKKSDKPQAGIRTKTFGTDIGSSGISGGESDQPWEAADGRYPSNVIGEVSEGYQKYFYCPKVSRKERHSGFDIGGSVVGDTEEKAQESLRKVMAGEMLSTNDKIRAMGGTFEGGHIKLPGSNAVPPRNSIDAIFEEWLKKNSAPPPKVGNFHCTVKPVALMDYLIKLVTPPSTPELQRKVLDPFMGSGSTGMAATALGHHFTGCELDPKYVAIAETRIEAWNKKDDAEPQLPSDLFEYR